MGGSGDGRLDRYPPHVHWGQTDADNPGFIVDYSKLHDPMQFYEEVDLNRLERLEAVVIGNGFDAICRPGTEDLFPAGTPVVPEGQGGSVVRLTGEPAVEYAKRRGFSLGLAINGLNDVVRD